MSFAEAPTLDTTPWLRHIQEERLNRISDSCSKKHSSPWKSVWELLVSRCPAQAAEEVLKGLVTHQGQ